MPGAAVINHNALTEDGEITVTLAEGQSVTNLTAAYQLSDGTKVTAGQGQTDFSSPVTYTLEREGESKNYVVTISFAQDAAPQQESFFTATFETDTPGEKPADAAIFASGTSSGGRYAVGGDNDAASYVTVAEEDGKKAARVQMGNAGLWSGLMTKSVTADELLGATELRLAFRMKLGEAPIANGRIALIGYNGDADAIYQGNNDGGPDMDLTYISEGVIWPCNHDSVPGTSIGWQWGGWADVEIKYEVNNGVTRVFARSKPVDAQWNGDEGFTNFGNNNDGFNFDGFDRYAVVFTSGLTDQPGYYFIDDISLSATLGKDLARPLQMKAPITKRWTN